MNKFKKMGVAALAALALGTTFSGAALAQTEPLEVASQQYVPIQPFNGAVFQLNSGVSGVAIFSDAHTTSVLGRIHGGTTLTVVNTLTPNGRVQVRIGGSGGTGWGHNGHNGSVVWVAGVVLDRYATHISGPAF